MKMKHTRNPPFGFLPSVPSVISVVFKNVKKYRLILSISLLAIAFLNPRDGVCEPLKGLLDEDLTWRYPLISVPRVTNAPTVDGRIEESEWNGATCLPPFMNSEPSALAGVPASRPTHVWMAYTDKALYLAWRQELPLEQYPPKADAQKRDEHEGKDNSVQVFLSTEPEKHWEQFQISGNAKSMLCDRRLDLAGGTWDPKVTYQARLIESSGWEGELEIPFKELGLDSAPSDGTRWNAHFYSMWRKVGEHVFCWPFVGWRQRGQTATLVFGGKTPAIRFTADAQLAVEGDKTRVDTKLFYRAGRADRAFFFPSIARVSVVNLPGSKVPLDFSQKVDEELAFFKEVPKIDVTGEYLLRYNIQVGEQILARGTQPFYKAPEMDLVLTPHHDMTKGMLVTVRSVPATVQKVKLKFEPGTVTGEIPVKNGQGKVALSANSLKPGEYRLLVEGFGVGDTNTVLATASFALTLPLPASPHFDGLKLVFVRSGDTNISSPRRDLLVKDEGKNERVLLKSPAMCMSPRWSPDGQWIAFSGWRDLQYTKEFISEEEIPAWRVARNQQEIWIIHPDGTGLKRLTDHEAHDGSPAWSPDGKQIAFVSERAGGAPQTGGSQYSGTPQVFIMNADGSGVQQVTRLKNGAGDPAWSPDGKKLAFMGREGDYFSIYRINVDGTGLKRLTDVKADERYPAWSPDGKTVVFSSLRPDYREAYWKLWAMDAEDGGNVRCLATDRNEPWYEFGARFSRDGKRIYYWSLGTKYNLSIRVMNADGSGREILMSGESGDSPFLVDVFESASETNAESKLGN